MSKKLVITIDGPAGAGKTTVSRGLAKRLGYTYVDTGALYRGIAVAAKAKGIAANDDDGLAELCKRMVLRLITSGDRTRVVLNGDDITDQLRTPEITMLASAVSARPVVRSHLLDLQRALGAAGGVVFEGRDMGTVVFPDADAKFFLDASLQERSRRRHQELAGNSDQTLAQVRSDMQRRDANDSSRDLAPLQAAADAVCIDSTRLDVAAVIDLMVETIRSKPGGSERR